MSDAAATLNMKNLENFIKALGGTLPEVHVGILGDSSARDPGDSGSTKTNAEIGAIHEFGTDKLPVRSFLRLPIYALLFKELESKGAFDKKVLAEVVATKNVRPWLEKIAIVAEDVVLGAFDTGGYGTWIPSDMRYKKNEQTLVETGQLRNSIKSEVVD